MLAETMHVNVWNAPGKGLILLVMSGYQIFSIATLKLQLLIVFWLVFKQCGERNSVVDTVVSFSPELRLWLVERNSCEDTELILQACLAHY